MRFAVVQQENEELVGHFEARKFPQIRVYESYDTHEEQLKEEITITKYKGDKDYNLKDLIAFLKPFARKDEKEKVQTKQEKTEQKQKAKQPYVDLTSENFSEKVLS